MADALEDPDLETRRYAIEQLGWIRDPGTLPLLQRVILSGDADTIEYAVGSARLLGPLAFGVLLHAVETGPERSREPVMRCIENLLSGSEATANLEALRRLRPEHILVRALNDSNRLVRIFAALILARLGDAAGADELVRTSRASDARLGTISSSHVAMAALHALGRPGYLALLTAALQSADRRVVQDREAIPDLRVLFGPDHTLNHHVARALVAIGRVDAASGRVLVQAMDSPYSTARIHAAAGVISLYTR